MEILDKKMVEYVLEKRMSFDGTALDRFKKCGRYANFLSQPLKLGMFIPCNDVGEILEEPIAPAQNARSGKTHYQNQLKEYQKALDEVIFDGFEMCQNLKSYECLYNRELNIHIPVRFKNKTIESLIPYKLKLKPKWQNL
jgi:hypothetical protein